MWAFSLTHNTYQLMSDWALQIRGAGQLAGNCSADTADAVGLLLRAALPGHGAAARPAIPDRLRHSDCRPAYVRKFVSLLFHGCFPHPTRKRSLIWIPGPRGLRHPAHQSADANCFLVPSLECCRQAGQHSVEIQACVELVPHDTHTPNLDAARAALQVQLHESHSANQGKAWQIRLSGGRRPRKSARTLRC